MHKGAPRSNDFVRTQRSVALPGGKRLNFHDMGHAVYAAPICAIQNMETQMGEKK